MNGRVAARLGAAAALGGLVLIWVARACVPRPLYVSELGASGMPTAPLFSAALIAIASGAALIAMAGGHPHSRMLLLGAWPIGATIAVSSVCFVVASQVTCSAGCPVPVVDQGSGPRDLVHTIAAVLGFTGGCLAMLQVAFARHERRLARASVLACCLVGTITIAGGLLSVFRIATAAGGVLEFAGTTVAVGWVACYGIWLGRAERGRRVGVRPLALRA